MRTVTTLRNKNSITPPQLKREDGYTLIQMAIALLVFGLLTVGFLQIYTNYMQTQKIITTQENINQSVQLLQSFRQTNGRYPCPSPVNANRNVAGYGAESDYARYLATGALPLAIGDCAEGICIESNVRADIAGTPNLRVRVGAIPFRNMQMDEDITYDGYGSRLWYAVTEDMCNLATFDDTRGAIDIQNNGGVSQTNPANSAAFIVISSGPNKLGGYNSIGNQAVPCAASADAENCRDVSVTPQAATAATYLLQMETPNFDDTIEYFSASVNQLWRRTNPTSEHIVDLSNSNVAVGIDAPTSTLHIAQSTVDTTGNWEMFNPNNTAASTRESGALRVNKSFTPSAKLYSSSYCDQAGANCFKAEDITGDPDAVPRTGGIKCATPNTYPVRITSDGTNAQFACIDDLSMKCPVTVPPSVFIGFTVDGTKLTPRCSNANSFRSCPAATMTPCAGGADIDLLPQAHGFISPEYSRGDCRQVKYTCTDGSWGMVTGYPKGHCTATPGAPVACDACWSGTKTTNSCGVTDTSACTCDANPATCYKTVTSSCGIGFNSGSGGERRYRKKCVDGSPSSAAIDDATDILGTEIVASSCSCTLKSNYVYSVCPANKIRANPNPALDPSQTPTSDNWATAPNNTYGKATLKTPNGDCNGYTTTEYNHCVCNTDDRFEAVAVTAPACKKAKQVPLSRTYGGTAYRWNLDVYRKTVNPDCTENPRIEPAESPAEFVDLQTKWREIAGSATNYNQPRKATYPLKDYTCDCPTYGLDTTAPCQISNGLGGFTDIMCKCAE